VSSQIMGRDSARPSIQAECQCSDLESPQKKKELASRVERLTNSKLLLPAALGCGESS
jgi:hypothetical protein